MKRKCMMAVAVLAVLLMAASPIAASAGAPDVQGDIVRATALPEPRSYLYTITTDSSNVQITSVKASVDGSALSQVTGARADSEAGASNISDFWDFDPETGMGPFNSFYAAINITKGTGYDNGEMQRNLAAGTIAFVLDPYDLKRTINGTAYCGNYNIMLVIPTVYWKAEGNVLYLSSSPAYAAEGFTVSGMTAYAHTATSNGSSDVYPYVALGVYEASVSGGKLLSASGATPGAGGAPDKYKSYADKLTPAPGSGYQQWNFYQWTLYKMMAYTVMGTKNSQAMLGDGPVNGSWNTFSASTTGLADAAGPYADSTSSYSKLFIENPWGSLAELVGDTYFQNNTLHTDNALGGRTIGPDYTTSQPEVPGAVLPSNTTSGWIVATYSDSAFWDLPRLRGDITGDVPSGLSASGDMIFWFDKYVLMVGGDWRYGSSAGVACVYGDGYGGFERTGARLAYVMAADAAAPPGPITVPTPAQGLVYDGGEQTGVPPGDWYAVEGGSAVSPGTYTAVVTLDEGLVWDDGTSGPKTIEWGISKAVLTATYVGETVLEGGSPAYEVSVTGFVGGETAATAAGYSAPAVDAVDPAVGTYEMVPYGGSADNYVFIYVPGALDVIAPPDLGPDDYLYAVTTDADNVKIVEVSASLGGSALATISEERTAGGASEISEFWDFDPGTGVGPFNSFYAAINISEGSGTDNGERMINHAAGTIAFVLDPYDLSKTLAGTTLEGTYNVMLVIPTVYWKAMGNVLYLSSSPVYAAGDRAVSGMTAYAHTVTSNGSSDVYPYVALGVYEASVSGGKLLSVSGTTPQASTTHDKFKSYADALTPAPGSDYQQWNFYQWTLYKMMAYTVMGTKNSQAMMGDGPVNNTSPSETGLADAVGPYAESTSGYSKLFIENSWGSLNEFVGDACFYNRTLYAGNTLGGRTIADHPQPEVPGAVLPSSYTYWIGGTYSDSAFWDLTKSTGGSSSSLSGSGDYVWLDSGWRSLLVGGDWNDGSWAGVADLHGVGLSYWTSNFGSRLAYVMSADAAAVPVPTPASGLVYDGGEQAGVPSGYWYAVEGGSAVFPGTYTAVLTLDEGHVWDDGTSAPKQVEWEISKAVLTATYAGETVRWGEEPACEVLVEGFVGGESGSTASGYSAPVVHPDSLSAGAHVLAPSGGYADNYSFVYVPGVLEVVGIEAPVPSPVIGIVYDGNEQAGVPPGEGYSVEGGSATGAGTYTAVLTLDEGHVWDDGTYAPKQLEWEISRAVLTATYVGETVHEGEAPAYAVSVTGFVGGETPDTAAEYIAPAVSNGDLSPGSRLLAPSGGSARNYVFEYVPGTLTVIPLGVAQVPSPVPLVYSGEAQTGVPEGEGYSVSGNTATDAGSYTATLSLSQWYRWSDGSDGQKAVEWSISPAVLTATYAGETVLWGEGPAYAVSVDGFVGGESASTASGYVAPILRSDDLSVGAHELIPSGGHADNYTFVYVSGILEVAGIVTAVPDPAQGLVYDGGEQAGVPPGDWYAVEGGSAVYPGTYTAVLTLDEGHVWEDGTSAPKQVEWEISKAVLTAAYAGETVYEGENPAYAVSVTGFVGGETAATAAGYAAPTVSCLYLSVGDHVLTPSGGSADNYSFRYVPGTLTVAAVAVGSQVRASGLIYEITSLDPLTASLVGYEGSLSDVVVPASMKVGGREARVVSVGAKAFYGCGTLASVDLGSVSEVEYKAFANCSSMKTLVVSDTVERIGSYAFYGCKMLTSLTIPGDGVVLEPSAFSACVRMKSVSFTGEGAVIERNAFYKNNGVAALDLANVASVGYKAFPYCKGLTTLTVPGTLESLGGYAFYSCASLRTLVVEKGVEAIGASAFSECRALQSISLPGSLESIGKNAFYGVRLYDLGGSLISQKAAFSASGTFEGADGRLWQTASFSAGGLKYTASNGTAAVTGCEGAIVDLVVPRTVEYGGYALDVTAIGDRAFRACATLATADLGGVVTVGNRAFSECSGLSSVEMPSVEYLDDYALFNCKAIERISFSDSLEHVGASALYGVKLYGADGATRLTAAEDLAGMIFEKTGGILRPALPEAGAELVSGGVRYVLASTDPLAATAVGFVGEASSLPSAVVFNGYEVPVTSVADGAFRLCATIAVLDLSNAVSIGAKAFSGCTGLESVSFSEGLSSIGSNAFYGTLFYDSESNVPRTAANLAGKTFEGSGGSLFLVS